MAIDWKALGADWLEAAMDDSEAEIRCYEMVAKFEEIEFEIADFYDAMVNVFGGFTWFDYYGDAHYSTDYNEMLQSQCKFCPNAKHG
jgi:hypothetical protein